MGKLEEGITRLNLKLSEDQIAKLNTYADCVLEFNKTYNLMKAESKDDLAVSHILDSLVAVPHIKELAESLKAEGRTVQMADIGSGGGCPGIPLAVAFPELSFTLVERMEKRCDFLNSAIKTMNLTNVKVLNKQADLVKGESFDIEVFRAFHPFDKKITKLLMRMLKKGGYLAAYKAREEKIIAEMEEVKELIPEYKKITLTVPFLEDHQRNLVVVKK